MKKLIKNMDFEELLTYVLEDNQPKYRAEQLFKELYVKRVDNVSEMTTIPKLYREVLSKYFKINSITDNRTKK